MYYSMRSHSRLLLLLGASLLLAAAGTLLPAPAAEAAWSPAASLRGVVIQQVGAFAVTVYDLARHRDLSFVGVVRGETEAAVGGGTNYRLVVAAASPDGSTAQYECLVWGVPGSRADTWKLHRVTKIGN